MRLTVTILVSLAFSAPFARAAEITLQTEHTGSISRTVYSPDGKLLATASTDSTVKLWSLPDGRLVKTFTGHSGEVKDVAFSPDGKLLASIDKRGAARVWNLPDCELIKTFKPESRVEAKQIVFSPDGGFLLASRYDLGGSLVSSWSLPEFKLVQKLAGEPGELAFSPDGKLAAIWFSKRLRIFQMPELKKLAEVTHQDKINAVAFSPDGKYLATGGWDRIVKLWTLPSGKPVRAAKPGPEWVEDLAFSPDGKLLAAGMRDGTVQLFAMPKGRLLRKFKTKPGYDDFLSFAPKGNLLASKGVFWKMPRGTVAGRIPSREVVSSIMAVSPDMSTFLSKGKRLELLSFPSGRLLATLHGSAERFPVKKIDRAEFATRGQQPELVLVAKDKSKTRLMAFPVKKPPSLGDDSAVAFSAGVDGFLRFKLRISDKTLLTMVLFEDGEWIAYTPDGRYEASIDAASRIAWRFGTDVAGFEQYEADFHRPGLVRGILTGNPPKKAPPPMRPPHLDLRNNRELITTRKGFITVQMEVSDPEQVEHVRVFVNGRLSAEKSVKARQQALAVRVPLGVGTNRVTAIAYNHKGYSSFPKFLDVEFKKLRTAKPDLFFLAVGISEYPKMSGEFQLDYADDDARALARAFNKQKGKLFRNVRSVTLTGKQATVDGIQAALKQMRKLKPGSLAIVFLAGHGVKDDRTGKYYYLTRNSRFEDPAGAGLDWEVFQDLLSQVKCRVVLLLDTCHSGAISEETIVPNDELVKKMLADHRSGVLIFTAAKGRQESVESPDLGTGEGLFTWAILEALEAVPWNHLGKKTRNLVVDANGDKSIQASELMRYVTGRTHDISGGFQTPRISRQEICGDFPLASGVEVEPRRLAGHTDRIDVLAVSPNSKFIASGGQDHAILLWTLPGRKPHRTLKGHSDDILQLVFTPRGKHLVSGARDKTIRIWSVPGGKPRKKIAGHASRVSALAVSPDGKLLASGSAKRFGSESGNTIKIWSLPAGKPVRTLGRDEKSVYQLAFSPDGKFLAARTHGLAVKVWSVAKWKLVAELEGHSNNIEALVFTPDGRHLLTGGKDRRINLWSIPDGKLVKTIREHKQGVVHLALSPGGSYFASGGEDGEVVLWSLPGGERLKTATEKGYGRVLSFSPDGSLLASGSRAPDPEILLWSVPDLSRQVTFFKHLDHLPQMLFSPNGKWLVAPGRRPTVKVWSLGGEGLRSILEAKNKK